MNVSASTAGSPTRVLTGATDGIGRALAELWIARGLDPLLSGRRPVADLDPELTRELATGRYLQADLTNADGPRGLAEGVLERTDRLERLVLNAGLGWFGSVADQTEAEVRDLVALNLWAPMELVHRLLPALRRGRGRVVLVSSVVSALACARYAVYGSTKAGLEGFARALRVELRGDVEVQVLRPGATWTGMHAKAGMTRSDADWERFPTATEVARALDRHIEGAPRWATIGAVNRVAQLAGRLAPWAVDRAMAWRMR